ncbi:hypothetical protein KEM54_003368 [Ascosphaera aggregata]|nr:hypothetical protein KEM54_003368 [Ascosphaera aggregata]
MVYDIIRDSLFGQTVRYLTGNKYFLYPEEQPGFNFINWHIQYGLPEANDSQATAVNEMFMRAEAEKSYPSYSESPERSQSFSRAPTPLVPEHVQTVHEESDIGLKGSKATEEGEPVQLGDSSSPIKKPIITKDGDILVGWYSDDDPENPQNWSTGKKWILVILIFYYTFAVYGSSAIYTSSLEGVQKKFNIGPVTAELGLSIYVLGYGIGPLIWAPMSEIPRFGRNVPYLSTFLVFFILSIPTALANNFPGLVVLRFLQGFFGSPSLANGGATMHDLFPPERLPYTMALWVCATYAGPSIGPLISGFSVSAKGWRWSLWEIVWMATPAVFGWIFLLPETSPDTILLHRAQRLRKLTNNPGIKTAAEIKHADVSFKTIAADALIKPFEISIKDPAVAFVHIYTAIIYGVYYSFFESFPLVFPVLYGMNLGMTGVLFTCLIPACFLGLTAYCIYVHFSFRYQRKTCVEPPPEHRLLPGLIAPFGQTAGLFLFAWTANEKFPWIVPILGVVMNSASAFLNMQSIFMYLPVSYPQYAASLFGMNDFVRSAFAFCTIMFSRDMFLNLGIARGVSLLGGLSVFGIFGMWTLYFYGRSGGIEGRYGFGMD